MPGLRSVTAGGTDWAKDVAKEVFPRFATLFPHKYAWFATRPKPYAPHEWQAAFHAASNGTSLCRYRHLVAGRRGGKTMSAAWEVLFYCLFPQVFHQDFPGPNRRNHLWVWVLAKDHELGRPSRVAFLEACNDAGLVKDKDYKYNKSEKMVEFANGSVVHFRTGEDPQSLRGAGLDILWIDEAAMLPTSEAYEVARPALSDKVGLVITTTTPKGKNWLYQEFWKESAVEDPAQFRVEYTFIDNPFNSPEEWEWAREHFHPIMFKQEYLAAFDAMSGVELHGDWLHYYSMGTPDHDEIELPVTADGKLALRKYMAVDPAVSLSDRADHFCMALVGISNDNSQAFLLATYKDRIPFPDQVDKIKEWFLKYRPEYIGIESNAYQRALAQQAERMTGLPPIVPVISRGKKFERILSMAPIFKIGKMRIHKSQKDFIDEWVSYDSTMKNSEDDLLDAVEIALGAAGVLLPIYTPLDDKPEGMSLQDEVDAHIASLGRKHNYDPELGAMA